MKKFYFLFFLLWVGFVHSQCINTIPFGNIVSDNSGNFQSVTTCAYTSEFSTVSGLTVGANYLFTGQLGTTPGSGAHVYLTITDANNVVIQHGTSPLLVNGITASTIRMHYSDNAACGQTSVCHNGQVQLVLPCPAPISLTATAITSDSATLGWTALGSPDDFVVQWGVQGFTLGSGAIVTGIASNSYALTGLNPATAYQFYVRSNCGTTEQSPWAGPFSFITSCVTFVPPTLEAFDSFTSTLTPPPPCWSRADNGTAATGPTGGTTNNNWWGGNWRNTAGTPNGTAARFNIYTINRQGWLISPLYDLSGGGYSVFYDVAAVNYAVSGPITGNNGNMGPDDEFRFMMTTDNGATWTTVELFNESNTPPVNGTTKTYDISSVNSATVRFAFYASSGATNTPSTDYDVFVDNFSVASCLPATNLNITGLTNTVVNLNWTASISNPANGYEWEIRTSGVAGSGATGLVQSGNVGAGITTVAVSGLTPATVYQFYVRSVCSASDNSVWIQGPSFTTLCDLVTSFSQNFDSTTAGTGILPPCWSRLGNSTVVNVVSGAAAPLSGPNRLQISAVFESTVAYALMPPVSNLQAETHRLRFRAFSTSVGRNLEVGYFTDESDLSTFVSFETVPMPGTAQTMAEEFIVIPTGIPAGVTRLVFRNLPSASGTALIYVDDVVWQEIPNCLNPNLLTASGITNVSAQLQWNVNGSEVEWDIKYGAPGFNVQTEGTLVSGIFDNPYTLSGLTPNTSFSYYVRAVCDANSNDYSPWEGPFTFTTLCDPYTIPYFEGFESGFTHNTAIAGCYSQASVTGASVWTANNTFTDFNRAPRTGAWNAFLQWSNEDWLFIPVQLTGGTSYTLQFYARQDGSVAANSNVSASFGETNSTGAMVNEIVPVTGIVNGAYQEFIGNFTPSASGIYFVGIKGFMNGSPWYISLDDISIIETPACPAPLGVTAAIASNSSLNLSWTNQVNAADGYEWRVMLNGDDVNNDTPAVFGATSAGVTTALATGLSVGSVYQVYVRSVCDASTTSIWSSPFTISLDYCASVPTSVDAQGITNIVLGSTNFTNTNASYTNHTATVVDLQQGVNANVQITFATGYTYNTNIWIDFNDDLVFDASELVYQGESLSANPTTLNASFIMPLTATLGTHRMRIGTADSGQFTPNPCYNGSWGVTLDFAVNILPAPACPSPLNITTSIASATSIDINWTDISAATAGYEWRVMNNNDPVATGTPVASGNTAAGVTTALATGLVFENTYQVYVRSLCDASTTSDWSNAVNVFLGYCIPNSTSTSDYISSCSTTGAAGSNINLTQSQISPNGYNNLFNSNTISHFADSSFDMSVTFVGGGNGVNIWVDWNNNLVFDANENVFYLANADATKTGTITIPAGTPNGEYRLRVRAQWGSSANPPACGSITWGEAMDFKLIVDSALSTNTVALSELKYYPNPVVDVLNLTNNTAIERVEIYNLLGQQVMQVKTNATQTSVQVGELAKGAYIVKAYADGVEHTFKIIKN
ncbi:MAG: GEVED domain-containing protein [Flavobacterium sp.]